MKNKKQTSQNVRINNLKLWILFGIAWMTPQLITIYLPEELQILKAVILIVAGFIVMFDKSFGDWFLK